MSSIDYKTKRLDKVAARKLIAEIVTKHAANVHFSRHALDEMDNDDLCTPDIWNVLKSSDSRIIDEGELEKGSYRYRLETAFIMVVIAFTSNGDGLFIVTVWDKRKGSGT